MYIIIHIYPDTTKHQSKPQDYKSDIAPCGQTPSYFKKTKIAFSKVKTER